MTEFYPTFDGTMIRPYMPAVPVLLSASSFEATVHARHPGTLPVPLIPPQVPEIAVDPGGFVAQVRYGGYRFSWDAFVEWLHRLGPRLSWAAFPDLPCEPELADTPRTVRQRQEQTLRWTEEYFWGGVSDDTEGYLERQSDTWAWVPTIQGRNLSEYVWMAEQLEPLLRSQILDYDMAVDPNHSPLIFDEGDFERPETQQSIQWSRHGAMHRRVAIGSLCQRRDVPEIVRIVRAVSEVLPEQRFHLWGVKLQTIVALAEVGILHLVASLDSAAWNGRFGSDIPGINAEQARLGMTQREYAIKVRLPEYLAKVQRALEAPVTRPMFA